MKPEGRLQQKQRQVQRLGPVMPQSASAAAAAAHAVPDADCLRAQQRQHERRASKVVSKGLLQRRPKHEAGQAAADRSGERCTNEGECPVKLGE